MLSVFTAVSLIVAMAFPSQVFARESSDGGGSGFVALSVNALGLDVEDEAQIVVTKEIDGVYVDFQATTVNHIAIFNIPVGGSCSIIPQAVAGYTTPDPINDVSLTRFKGSFALTQEVTYQKTTIAVSGITIDQSELALLVGTSATINATIAPVNASNQTVIWSSSDQAIASVVNGVVSANSFGTATITARAEDESAGVFFQECTVKVGQITAINALSPIDAIVGETAILPATVSVTIEYPAAATITQDVAVSWVGVGSSNTVTYFEPGTYNLTGTIAGSSFIANLTINVAGEPVTGATDVILTYHTYSLYLTQSFELGFSSVVPAGASTSAIMWQSSNPSVATVTKISDSSALVTAQNTTGIVTITAYVEDSLGNPINLDSCTVNVGIDPTVTDPVYIVATTFDSPESVDIFDSREDVYIRGYGLTPGVKYYVKVEEKGSKTPLGTGEFTPDQVDDIFNLYNVTSFDLSTSFSKSYFVSMSKESNFPSGDYEDGTPKNLFDNFKITSPVPTGSIVVDVTEYISGYPQTPISPSLVGKDVILGRILDEENVAATCYEDYLNDPSASPALPKYTDEVKLIGHINADGTVSWDVPKEKLKIGGYLLLVELPQGYTTNLNELNPDTDDGSLLKEVHITRNDVVYRSVDIILANPQ